MQRLNFANMAAKNILSEKAVSEKGGDSGRSRLSSSNFSCKIIGPSTRTNSARDQN